MECNDELKEIDIKNCTCYYFDNIMASRDTYSGNILLEEKLYKNVLICDILHKNFVGSQLLCIWFNKIHGFIQIYDGTRYLVLLGHNWYDEICDSIKYLISKNSGITDNCNHNFARIRIYSYNSLLVEKILTFYNFMILINQLLIWINITASVIHFW